MDGGLALAILPLIISAAEHWDDVLRPFKTFIRYAIELDKFQWDLKLQKSIYHNQYHRLISFSTDPDTARAMLSDRRHLYWTNRELDQNLAQLLGDSLDNCIYLTKSIQLKLKELEKKEESFLAGVKQEVLVSVFKLLHMTSTKATNSPVPSERIVGIQDLPQGSGSVSPGPA
jgi:hypothetical protein